MRRALFLIIGLSILTFGSGLWLDNLRQTTAQGYLEGLHQIRRYVNSGQLDQALKEQTYLHALWQHDAHWLNLLIDHHHTRDVDSFMCRLSTSLAENNRLISLLTLDDIIGALEEVSQQNMLLIENIM